MLYDSRCDDNFPLFNDKFYEFQIFQTLYDSHNSGRNALHSFFQCFMLRHINSKLIKRRKNENWFNKSFSKLEKKERKRQNDMALDIHILLRLIQKVVKCLF